MYIRTLFGLRRMGSTIQTVPIFSYTRPDLRIQIHPVMQKLLYVSLPAFLFFVPFLLAAQPKIQLTPFASGFTRPVDITQAGDSRLFIVEQSGLIWILDSLGNRQPDPFLDIDARVRSTGNEQGLLGLAFSPDFAQTGAFYVYYTREPDGDTRVSRFFTLAGDPNRADPDSEEILVTQNQPNTNHNGGCLKFGPEGYLYISLGDGGGAGDTPNNAQTKNTLLGKILRIDVNSSSSGLPYSIPLDNPFVFDTTFRPEIWSWGWRNPWRFSFDRLTGDMWVGDVGQNAHEEIDFEPAFTGGRNYGWRCYEGFSPFNTAGCLPADNYTKPVFDYPNPAVGRSVTGGFVYRGKLYSDLYGFYLFADYVSGRWWATRQLPDSTFSTALIADLTNNQYSAFGEDIDGELYVAALSQGIIYKIRELCSSFQISGTVINATCSGSPDGAIELDVSGGVAPYSFTWANGQSGPAALNLDPGVYPVQVVDAQGCIRLDTFEVGAGLTLPEPLVLAIGNTNLCAGDSVWLQAGAAPGTLGYQWYKNGELLPADTTSVLVVHSAGIYTARYSSGACLGPLADPIEVQQSFPPVIQKEAGADILSISGQYLSIQWVMFNSFTQMWDPIPNATDTVYAASTEGLFSVQVVDEFGCSYQADPVGISALHLPQNVVSCLLAPNPTQRIVQLTLDLERPEQVNLILYDAAWRQISSDTQYGQRIVREFDLQNKPTGSYYLAVQMENGSFVRTLVRN